MIKTNRDGLALLIGLANQWEPKETEGTERLWRFVLFDLKKKALMKLMAKNPQLNYRLRATENEELALRELLERTDMLDLPEETYHLYLELWEQVKN